MQLAETDTYTHTRIHTLCDTLGSARARVCLCSCTVQQINAKRARALAETTAAARHFAYADRQSRLRLQHEIARRDLYASVRARITTIDFIWHGACVCAECY